jgi:hypothetical protein
MREIMAEATPTDLLYLSLVAVGICFAAIFMTSFVLQFIVALKARPARRALWSVGPPTLLVGLGFALLGTRDDVFQAWVPLAVVPAALLAYAYWYFTFRRAWVDDDNVPAGTRLSNDDWTIGLGIVVLVLAANVLKNVFLASF